MLLEVSQALTGISNALFQITRYCSVNYSTILIWTEMLPFSGSHRLYVERVLLWRSLYFLLLGLSVRRICH